MPIDNLNNLNDDETIKYDSESDTYTITLYEDKNWTNNKNIIYYKWEN